MKLIEITREPTREYSQDTWCVQYGCHCSYLAGIDNVRCKNCEQESVTEEYKLVEV